MIKAYNQIHGLADNPEFNLPDDEFNEEMQREETKEALNKNHVARLLGKSKSSRVAMSKAKPHFFHEKLMRLIATNTPFIEHLKGLQRLQAMRIRLQYNRRMFDQCLKTRSNFYSNLSEQLPNELKIWRLPISYHFYDAVPVIMAINLINHHKSHLEVRDHIAKEQLDDSLDIIRSAVDSSDTTKQLRALREANDRGFLGFIA